MKIFPRKGVNSITHLFLLRVFKGHSEQSQVLNALHEFFEAFLCFSSHRGRVVKTLGFGGGGGRASLAAKTLAYNTLAN